MSLFSIGRSVWLILFHPVALFDKKKHRPDIVGPVVLMLLGGAIMLYSQMPLVIRALHVEIGSLVRLPQYPHFFWYVLFMVLFALSALVLIASVFVNALIIAGLLRIVKVQIPFAVCASFYAYSQVPQALRTGILGLYGLLSDMEPPIWGIGMLFPDAHPWFRSALWNVDFFLIWSYVLLGLAFCLVIGEQRWRGWTVASALLGINVLLNSFLIPADKISQLAGVP